MISWLTLITSSPLFFVAHQATKKITEVTKDDALIISIIGLVTVFSGLLILSLSMNVLAWFFNTQKKEKDPSTVDSDIEDTTLKEEDSQEEEDDNLDENDDKIVIPPKNPSLVPVTMLSAAIMAYHLHEIGEIVLGEQIALKADNKIHQATILSLGYYNRVLVDDEEVIFNLSEVATNDDIGQKITPAE